jgi:hypothetical protein
MNTTVKPMTDPQFTFALSLATEVYTDPGVLAEELLKLAGHDFYTISVRIDELKALKAGQPKPAAPVATVSALAPLAYTPMKGYYLVNRIAYYIKPGKYGGVIVYGAQSSNKGCYYGSLASPKNAKIAAALSSEDMAYAASVAYGQKFGKCGVCGKTLTDPVSIAKKIGPVCAKKYGK